MAEVVIPGNELTAFDLPKVCVVTGATEGVVFKPVRFWWYPKWVIALIVVNLLIAAIVGSILTKRVKGELPFTEGAFRRWRRVEALLGAVVVLAIFLGLFALGALAVGAPTLWIPAALFALALPIVAFLRLGRGERVRCAWIAEGWVALRVPSDVAAAKIRHRLTAGSQPPVPSASDEGHARCAVHVETPAAWACERCGTFVCVACERRARDAAVPLCPPCWDLRARAIETNALGARTRLHTAGLVLGVLSVVPFFTLVLGGWSSVPFLLLALPLQIASLAVNITAIARAKESGTRERRGRPIVGLVLTGAALLLVAFLNVYDSWLAKFL